MTRHLLIGALGGPNFGDEAIFSAWVRTIRERDPAAEIFCDGYGLQNLTQYAKGVATVLRHEESLWMLSASMGAGDAEKSIWAHIESELKREDVAGDLADRLKALEGFRPDAIHIIGGGYFNELWPANYAILFFARMLAWKTGARLFASGLGLTPVNSRNLGGLRGLLSTFDHVDVRDTESHELFAGLDEGRFSCSGDDALLHLRDGDISYPLRLLDEPTLTICIQNDLFPGDTAASGILSDDLLRILEARGIRKIVYAIAMQGDVEGPPAGQIESLNAAGFTTETIPPFSLLEKGFPVSSDGLVITSRYHPHFFCALSGIKGVALTSIPYYDTKHRAVREMGSNWPVLGGEEELSGLPAVVESLWQRDEPSFRPEAKNGFIERKREIATRILDRNSGKDAFPIDIAGTWEELLHSLQRERGAAREREAQAGERESALRETIDRNQVEREQAQAELGQVRTELGQAHAEREQTHAELEQVRAELERARAEGAELKDRLLLMEKSRSWRWTAPIRKLGARGSKT
ncbi:polysaccharide pyruvyl transferase family protein [Rhizobium sp. LCM 4573]|uniref:polysaccharide pyruvyl transferase family protein n=1 Tax=Rhizobium sp. LCM 4573 TaxID=1848291 RepID=UPI0008DA5BF7|nr:polysaccharide pyruvyl transferase family protein [Rhizobium sp. LCM 4573]OHV75796.1 hypothetical protein LCM4573_14050 [Rhizobium sp. LCM 4573]